MVEHSPQNHGKRGRSHQPCRVTSWRVARVTVTDTSLRTTGEKLAHNSGHETVGRRSRNRRGTVSKWFWAFYLPHMVMLERRKIERKRRQADVMANRDTDLRLREPDRQTDRQTDRRHGKQRYRFTTSETHVGPQTDAMAQTDRMKGRHRNRHSNNYVFLVPDKKGTIICPRKLQRFKTFKVKRFRNQHFINFLNVKRHN